MTYTPLRRCNRKDPSRVNTYTGDGCMPKGLNSMRTLQLVEAMRVQELQPNVITYTAMISASGQGWIA